MQSTDTHGRRFVLGLGAAKTGTTWLYNYLASFPQADMGARKEYHVFDAVYLAGFEHVRDLRDPGLSRSDTFFEKIRRQHEMLEGFRTDHDSYFDYFDGMMHGDITISGDITPAYFGLPAPVLSMIRRQFEARNIAVKPVVLLRDPVDRVVSLARMAKRFGSVAGQQFDRQASLDTIISQLRAIDHMWSKTDYRAALESLFAAFEAKAVYAGIYERQFEEPEFERLNRFLGLDPKPDWLRRQFNTTRADAGVQVSPELLAGLREELTPQVRYCQELFPQFDLQVDWATFAGTVAR